MACSLTEEQVGDVYIYLRGEIMDRIKDSRLSKFDINETIKYIHNGVKESTEDEVKALFYAQAIPDIFNLVMIDNDVSNYLTNNDL